MKLDAKTYLEKYKPQIEKLQKQLKPLKDYWLGMSQRDQQVLMVVGSVVGLMLIMLIISSGIGFKNSLKDDYTLMAQQRIDAQIIAKQYKELSNITPNDFSSVNSDRIKGDALQVMGIKDAEVLFADNNLTIKVTSTKFDSVMLFLDQLRKSYGLFPNKLKITRLAQSGYVTFSASFNHVEQE